MNERDAFDRIMASLHEAMLDDAHWLPTSALIVDPASRVRIDPELVMAALDLTPAESQVAVMLAEGRTPRDIAAATGRRESTIRWHVQKMFVKHDISRQVELVRLVSPLAGVPLSRRSGR